MATYISPFRAPCVRWVIEGCWLRADGPGGGPLLAPRRSVQSPIRCWHPSAGESNSSTLNCARPILHTREDWLPVAEPSEALFVHQVEQLQNARLDYQQIEPDECGNDRGNNGNGNGF